MSNKIIVIDDDESILDAVSLILEDAGFKVKIILKAEGAYKNILDFKPDIILLDVLMSGNDGRLICKNLKGDNKTKKIPIIMFSAHPSAGAAALEYGADEFLAKPFDADALLHKIDRLLKKK